MTAVTEWASQEVQDEEYGHSVQNRVDVPGLANGKTHSLAYAARSRQSQQRTPPSPSLPGVDGRIGSERAPKREDRLCYKGG
jgi:hypothetical protein